MTTESTIEYARQCSYAVGMLEGILQKVRMNHEDAVCGRPDRSRFCWGSVEDMQHLCQQLREIEDRLWSQGEYAPTNVARVSK